MFQRAVKPNGTDKEENAQSSKDRSNDKDLELIHKWLKDRLKRQETRAESGKEYDTYKLQEKFVEQKIDHIKKELGLDKLPENDILFVTVRSNFSTLQEYLRPIYSIPSDLKHYLVVPEQQVPFSFEEDASTVFAGLKATYPKKIRETPQYFGALHVLYAESNMKDPKKAFGPRIDKFWTSLKKQNRFIELRNRAETKGPIYCFFWGRNKSEKRTIELDNIIAIYCKASEELERDENIRKRIKASYEVANSLFEGIELISKIDSSLFKMEGLQIIAEQLLPEFSNTAEAPADKVALAIRKIKEHLQFHLVGRQDPENLPEVYYFTASFEQDGKTPFFFPHLELYPHCDMECSQGGAYPVGSYQVAHNRIASATKFLLYKYLCCDSHRIVFAKGNTRGNLNEVIWNEAYINDEFKNLFSEGSLNTDSLDNWESRIWSADFPDRLCMVSYDKASADVPEGRVTPWKALNRVINPERENNSIIAFVVEGDEVKKGVKTFPRGVFAIESSHVDAFSDDDIRGLEAVFKGIASLIRQITHRNSPLDYRSSLAKAFEGFVPSVNNWGGEEYLPLACRLVFVVQTLDGNHLEKLCEHISNSRSNLPTHEQKSFLDEFSLTEPAFEKVLSVQKFCPGEKDSDIRDEEKAAEVLNLRIAELWKWFHDNVPDSTIPITLEFLEACTENFKWSEFLSSLGQTLGDRVNEEVPTFNFMTPGYSAYRMFIACVRNELHQVVKLSSTSKLSTERDNYRSYVRYRLVNSARIPVNAYAFDTQGKKGKGLPVEELSYGALVSDLVSVQNDSLEDVATLLSIMTRILLKKSGDLKIDVVQTALETLFTSGLSLWRKNVPKVMDKTKAMVAVREAFRLPKDWNPKAYTNYTDFEKLRLEWTATEDERRHLKLSKAHARFKDILNSKDIKNDILTNLYYAEIEKEMIGRDQLKGAIIHGDLNARNLTWNGSLTSFFMIDFEHVSPYFFGVDQFRLVVNLVLDLVSQALAEENSIEKLTGGLLTAIDSGVNFILEACKEMLTGANDTLDEVCSKTSKREDCGNNGCDLCHIITTLLRSIKSKPRSKKSEWSRFWGYVMFCSVLKEFEYSCRSTEKAKIDDLLKITSEPIIDMPAESLIKFLGNDSRLEPRRGLGDYFRYFTAAKMLFGICNSYFQKHKSSETI